MLRTNTCGELNKKDIDKKVKLCGWVHSRRDHGGLIFIDLRDRYGLTQIVFNPDNKDAFSIAEKLRREDVIGVEGKIIPRKKGMENPNLVTGEIEVEISDIEMLNKAETPPLEVEDRIESSEEMRLRYRYLDLRRPVMQNNLINRSKAMSAVRNYLTSQNFLEIETPMLMKATPEGARDYVVPSRVNVGKFYALPQSPQLYKQILMVAGFDRYFQLARCFRDEDLRADRQPDFTQIDLEMSFVEQDDVFSICEGIASSVFKEVLGKKLKTPFKKLSYKEAMDKYGIDKPDIRFDLFLTDVSEIAAKSDFGVFKDVISDGGIIKCINPEADMTRKQIDKYIELCQKFGAKGMAWMRVVDGKLDSNIAKYFKEDIQKELIKKVGAKNGSVLMFVAGKENLVNDVISRLRIQLGEDLKLYDKDEFQFCWIVDFPLFEKNEDGSWSPAHHMFTMPKKECIKFLDTDPSKVYATCYDLVLNGVELGSGSIRVHRPDIQEKIMDIVGFPKEKAEERFGFLLEAFKYGAPPHGGFAFGFDRLVALMLGHSDIREVIAFPKNKAAECPMDGCPTTIDTQQLKDLHIKLEKVKES